MGEGERLQGRGLVGASLTEEPAGQGQREGAAPSAGWGQEPWRRGETLGWGTDPRKWLNCTCGEGEGSEGTTGRGGQEHKRTGVPGTTN